MARPTARLRATSASMHAALRTSQVQELMAENRRLHAELARLERGLSRKDALVDVLVRDTTHVQPPRVDFLQRVLEHLGDECDEGHDSCFVRGPRLYHDYDQVPSREDQFAIIPHLLELGFAVRTARTGFTVSWAEQDSPDAPGCLAPTGQLPASWVEGHALGVLRRGGFLPDPPESWTDWRATLRGDYVAEGPYWHLFPDDCTVAEVERAWAVVCGADVPWRRWARSGLEFFFDPDDGEPDWCCRDVIGKLYQAQHGRLPPWGVWAKDYGLSL